MSKKIIIIPCGARKMKLPARAMDLYIGGYFRCNLRWARSVTLMKNIFILSAKYGLVPLDRYLAPYNLRMGDEGCVGYEMVADQAMKLGILDLQIIGIGGKGYTDILKKVFPNLILPVAGLSMGRSIQKLNSNLGRLP